MSGVIKSVVAENHSGIRNLTGFSPAIRDDISPHALVRKDPASQEVGNAHIPENDAATDITMLEREIEALREEIERTEAEAFARGREAGAAEAESRETERYELLSTSIDKAFSMVAEKLDHIDALAALLARSGLARIFADPDNMADLVANAISHRMSQIRGETVLSVKVSEADFPDADALAGLRSATGKTVDIIAEPGLASGESKIAMALGVLEIGPVLQTERFGELLLQLAEGERG